MGEMIKAMSIMQPWASAFFLEERPKDVENRERRFTYRGPLAIHASLGTSEIREIEEEWEGLGPELQRLLAPLRPFHRLPRGVLLGKGVMTDCLRVEDHRRKYGANPWAFGTYCHVIREAKALKEPVKWKGALYLFEVPEELFLPANLR
jgi:hypothetical protein